ncbi:MAG: hypothetical protein V4593_08325 [Pseudomonadota bacterium]
MSTGFNRGFPVLGDVALTADGRDLQLVSGAAKVAQSIKTRAQVFKGSWRYDRTLGVPYFQDILATGASVELVRRRFQELISSTDGVLSIQSLTVTFDRTRATVLVNFTAVSDTGEVIRDVLDFQAAS